MADNVMPAAKPEAALHGLLSVADVTEHASGDEHWANGFEFETEACNFNATLWPLCAPATDKIVLFDNSAEARFYPVKPFGITVEDKCSTIGLANGTLDRKDLTLRKLELVTQKALELELWSGAYTSDANADQGRWLSKSSATPVATGGAVGLKLGLALLEKALGDCGAGGRGVIHVPRDVGTMVDTLATEHDDGYLHTVANGNAIVSGVGYSGSAPGEELRSSANKLKPWIYATGPISVHLGRKQLVAPQLNEAVNVRTNELTWVAERTAAVYWDGCCHFGVQVDLTMAPTDKGSATIA